MKYFTTNEAIENIIETLQDFDGYISDLHQKVFNEDYYIIGTYKAEKALEDYGTFQAIGEVVSYEIENFCEILTDLSNPEEVSNMLWYIIGYDLFNDLKSYQKYDDVYLKDNDEESEKIKQIIIKELESKKTK
ncbi:hypothetical protein LaPh949_gp031 [Lactococcus phage 949]|uniref:Uncharacterized protein n=1 Tax=Lactococcus phage 949 TaxID=881953 RepID=E0YIR8_9CAUD|nr:hypothetical protein LaPh949_gp031 [Lactococcus phage 949]ADM73589.1 hypothetical protein [Lactococcus phage 949]